MSPALVAIVLAIGLGAVVAVSARDPAAASIGLAVALVGSGLLADPLPSAVILAVRIVAALLVATLIRGAIQAGPAQPSPLGWPAEALLATAGAVAGLGIAVGLESVAAANGAPVGGSDASGSGIAAVPDVAVLTSMALTVGAATMLFTLGLPPLLHALPGRRHALGLVLVAQSVLLLREGVAGAPGDLEEIARAALLVACGATGSAMASAVAIRQAREAERRAEDARAGVIRPPARPPGTSFRGARRSQPSEAPRGSTAP